MASSSTSLNSFQWFDSLTSTPSIRVLNWIHQFASESNLPETVKEIGSLLEARETEEEFAYHRWESEVRRRLFNAARWLNTGDENVDMNEIDPLYQTLESGIDELRDAARAAEEDFSLDKIFPLHLSLLTIAAKQAANSAESLNEFDGIISTMFQAAEKQIDANSEDFVSELKSRRSLCELFYLISSKPKKKLTAEKEKQKTKAKKLLEECETSEIRSELSEILASIARKVELLPTTLKAIDFEWETQHWRPALLMKTAKRKSTTTATPIKSPQQPQTAAAASESLGAAVRELRGRGKDPLKESLKKMKEIVGEEKTPTKNKVNQKEKEAEEDDEEIEEVEDDAEDDEESAEVSTPARPARTVKRKSTSGARRQKQSARTRVKKATVEATSEKENENVEEEIDEELAGDGDGDGDGDGGGGDEDQNSDSGEKSRRDFDSRGHRIRIPWSESEIRYLRRGMQEFGDTHRRWQSILDKYRDRFESQRTAVDLKDKWRLISNKRKRAENKRAKTEE